MKVAVIGAGIAGLTAASQLRERGVQVTVFEKSRGLGGRLATKRLDWASIDIGAQYFTARDPRFQKQLLQWQKDNIVAEWKFTPHVVTESGLRVQADSIQRYVAQPDMNHIAHELASDLEIHFNTRITQLEQCDGGWQLHSEYGKISGDFDWFVLSLPAEQSRSLLSGIGSHYVSRLMNRIPLGILEPCWALSIATRGEVEPELQGIFGDNVVSWVSRLSARPQRHIPQNYDDLWMLHFASEWSELNGKSTSLRLDIIGLEWLSRVLATCRAGPLSLVHAYQHYWRYARVNREHSVHTSVVSDRSQGIAVIGDWTAGGRVEGAYLSGLDSVDYILD